MYTSPEDDRSDLFLAAAVYVIGPEILGIILGWLPDLGAALPVVGLLVVLATTVLTPLLLMRYRKQRWSELGFGGPVSAAGLGALASLPVIGVYVMSYLVRGDLSTLALVGFPAAVGVGAALQLIYGLATMVLIIYVVAKARSAFRSDPAYIRPTMVNLGRFAAIGVAVATGLLVLTLVTRGAEFTSNLEVLLPPLGFAAAAWIAHRGARGSQLTSRSILLTPMVLLAVATISLFGQSADLLVLSVWQGAVLAAAGLVAAVLLESTRSAWAPMGFSVALALGLLSPLLV